MSKTSSGSDQYNKSVFPFYSRFSINIFKAFARALSNSTQFNTDVVAEKDDLVAPNSSKPLNSALTESHDKSLIEFNSGHVGLMIGKKAHKELWPKVGEWIKNHS